MSLTRIARKLAGLELYVVALAAAASVASGRLLAPALAVIILFWPIRWLAYRRLSVRTSGDWAIAGLLAMIPVTLWATALPEITQTQVLQLLVGIGLYYAVANWADRRIHMERLRAGLVAAGLGLALVAPFITNLLSDKFGFLGRDLSSHLPRLLAETVNPNVMAGALAILFPLAVAALLFSGHTRHPAELPLLAVAAIAMLAVLPLTESRGALLGVVASMLLLIALRWRWGWVAIPAGAMGAGLIVWRAGLERITELFNSGSAMAGLSGRLEVWSRAVYMIQDFPFTGIGMGSFKHVADLLYPFFTLSPGTDVPHAHNLILQVAVDLGLPGMAAWLALFLVVCLRAWQVYRRGQTRGDSWLAGLGAGLLASQVALIVHGLTDAVTWGTRPAVLVWALWGLAMAGWRVSKAGS